MTFPAYQDWANYTVPSADNVYSEIVAATLNYGGPTSDCSTWTSLNIVFENFASNSMLAVDISWGGYTPSVEQLDVDSFVCRPGDFVSITVPVKGRTVTINYSSLAGVPNAGVRYGIVGVSHALTKYDVRSSAGFLFNDNSSYGANTNKTIPSAFWYEGPASVCVFSDTNSSASCAFLSYDSLSFAYVAFAVCTVNSIAATSPQVVYFPPNPVEVFIQNPGAAQHIQVHVLPIATR